MCGCESQENEGRLGPESPHRGEEPPRETGEVLENAWFSCFVGRLCVGYENRWFEKTVARNPKTGEMEAVVLVHMTQRLEIQRFDAPTSAEIQHDENISPNGRLLEFQTGVKSGGEPVKCQGWVGENPDGCEKLLVHTLSFGKSQQMELAVPKEAEKDLRGGCGVEYSLWKSPPRPGEKRTFYRVEPSPLVMHFLRVEVECLPSAYVDFPDGRQVALYPVKVVSRMVSAAAPETGTPQVEEDSQSAVVQEEMLWVDGKGIVWKRYSPMMDMTFWRTSQEDAVGGVREKRLLSGEADDTAAELDFGAAVSVPIRNFDAAKCGKPLSTPQRTYRVFAQEGKTVDFLGVFESAEHQTRRAVKGEDGQAALEVTVFRSDTPAQKGVRSGGPSREDSAANNLIQSDAPKVRALAERWTREGTDPLDIARVLENSVFGFITDKNYARGFVTAAEVVELPAGDCTEHAVLFAAVARARGIPTRVVQGLVLVSAEEKFVWHVWNECYINKEWVPFDATVGQGVVGVDHIRVNAGSFDAQSLSQTLMPLARLVGRLEIEIGD